MSLQAASLFALVSVQGADKSISDLKRVSGQVNATTGVMAGLGKNATQVLKGGQQVIGGLVRVGIVAGAAMGAAAVASAKTAMTFQQQMELIHTQAGAQQSEVVTQSAAVQALVSKLAVGPNELAKGLYHIESAGARGSEAIDILKASAEGARVGLADMESVSNGLVAVWYSGITAAKDMSSNVGLLSGIVGTGNMRMQDLIDSFSTGILGTSKTFGVSLASMGAALATLSDAGVPPQVAATRLSMTFTHMAAPTGAAIKVLTRLKLAQFDLAKDLRKPDGVSVALKDLGLHLQAIGEMDKKGILTPKGTADIAKIFGGSRFGATAMQLLANVMQTSGDRVAIKYDQIIKQQDTFAEKLKATTETAGFTFAQLRANIEESALAFGQGFLPAVGRLGAKLNTILVSHLEDFRKLGVEVGTAIDNIDWTKVERGASTVVNLVKTLVDLISKVPPEITASVVGFEALNRVSGGLLGRGFGNIIAGIAGIPITLARSFLSKIPGIGQTIVSATAIHVWVDNFPPGFGAGGLPPVAGGPASLLSRLFSFVGPALLVAGTVAIATDISGINDPSHKTSTGKTFRGSNQVDTNIANQLAVIAQLTQRANNGDTFAAKQLVAAQAELLRLQKLHDAGVANSMVSAVRGTTESSSGKLADDLIRPAMFSLAGKIADDLSAVTRAIHAAVRTFSSSQIAGILSGSYMPKATTAEQQGILDRAHAKGFKPRGGIGGAAVESTWERDMVRLAQAQKTAQDQTTTAAKDTANAVRTHGGGQPITIVNNITVPAVQSYIQKITQIARYGPLDVNQRRQLVGNGAQP